MSTPPDHPGTCAYLNTTKHPFKFSAYEGIPENILINVLGWLLLLLMFAMLRKRAWDYGRIALVQKNEEKWTQLFYGRTDELVGLSSESASLSSAESTGVYVDKGFFSWIVATFKIRNENIMHKCGADAVQYLSFQKHIIVYIMIVMVISLCVILPINFQGDLEGDETSFGHTTLHNLDPSSPFLWAHVTLSILFLPLGIIIMRRFSISMKFEDGDNNMSRTLMITNIPRAMCDKNDLQRHFREAYPEMEIHDIQLAFDITKVSAIDKEREKAYQAKQYCENHLRNTGVRLDMRPYACGNICFCCDMFGCPKVDAIDYYSEEEQKLRLTVDEERNYALRRPLGIAFVTMSSADEASRIREDHNIRCQCAGQPPSSSLSHQLEPHQWKVDFAPPPSDIYWENLSVEPKLWYLKAFAINLFLFVILFFLTTPVIVVNLLDHFNFSKEIGQVNPILSESLPTLLLWTVAALLPALVSYSDQWMSHWTKSRQNHTIMRKCFIFLLFMVLILPSLGLTSAQAFLIWAVHPTSQADRWKCLFLPDKGAFFVNYVITSSLIGTGLELIRFPELFVYATRLSLARSQAETASVKKDILWGFPYGVQYAWMLLIFAMTIMYSLSCPLITPFGLLYMVMKHFVDKHNIYFVYGPSKINKQIHASAINAVIISIVMLQISFTTLSALRGLNDITIFALAGLVLTIITLIAHIFLNCCKGISPISYQSRTFHSDSEVGSPRRDMPRSPSHGTVGRSSSQQFVPEVLLSSSPSHPVSHPESPSAAGSGYGTHESRNGEAVVTGQPKKLLYQDYDAGSSEA
ncbi:calcium permeable stress-gated cation channel 1 isoform X1 [Ischnura elegans]|uniref:calcium permeable stress-gated cation channel 1 isoform X1 n=1 Tax=Ischnura elegans TaxID=197161 RepID=UPI001ED8941E|nr:calcium permeable stress-gated cation channel 1 isoform X1 [Ischnura elegans]